jgi:hypothetical protein
MDLLERYLQAVKFFLPRAQQDDIIRELSENLLSQMDDREAELGRPLTDDERAAIVKAHGHPMLVAGRYRSRQYLIGPTFFPIYLFALKAGIAVCALVTVFAAGIAAATSGDDPIHAWMHGMSQFPDRALMVFGWTTLGFALFDLVQARFAPLHAGWDPRSLPKVFQQDRHAARTSTLCELIFTSAALIWLLIVPYEPFLMLGPTESFLRPAPVWTLVYLPLVLLTVAQIAQQAVKFVYPAWTRSKSIVRLATHGAGLIVSYVLLTADAYVVPLPAIAAAAAPSAGQIQKIVEILNWSCVIGLTIGTVITLIEMARDLTRILRDPAHAPSRPASAAR